MANEISLESVETNLVATMEELDAQPGAATTFRVALLGDWSGRVNRSQSATGAELARWRPTLVDRDNLDDVMARLGVKLRLAIGGRVSLTLEFNKLDDFHPDRIFERAELFQALRETREQLSNAKTFPQAAAEVQRWMDRSESKPKATAPAPADSGASDVAIPGDNLLDQVLERSGGVAATPAQRDSLSPDLRSLVQEIVKPHLLPDETEQVSLIAAVDTAISEQMRAILHNPDFQALEASWRALDFLVSRLETGAELKLYLLDISFPELSAALLEHEEVRQSGIHKLLVETSVETFGGEPWAVLAGNYVFDFTTKGAELLKRMSVVAQNATAPFVAAGTSRIVGSESLLTMEDPRDWQFVADAQSKEAWDDLRRQPTASYLGLVLPRFLLRLPYGRETDATEDFSFEEMPENSAPQHEMYLWGNAVFAVTYLLAEAFVQAGWNMRPGECQEIEGLPIHVHKLDGDTTIKPCAEVLMTLRVAEKIIDHGPMPLITMKDTGVIRVGVFQSMALPTTNLAGRWGSS